MLINSIKNSNYQYNSFKKSNQKTNINFGKIPISPLNHDTQTYESKEKKSKKILYAILSLGILAGGAGSAGLYAHIKGCEDCKFQAKRIIRNLQWNLFDTEHMLLIEKHPEFSLINDILLTSEGIENEIYYDSKGKPTIGIGHLISHQKLSKEEIWENGLIEKQLIEAQRNTGLNISTKVDFKKLSRDQIFLLYYNDLLIKEQECKNLFAPNLKDFPKNKITWDDLTSGQKAALISLSFQVGWHKVAYRNGKPTTLLLKIRNGDIEEAQLEFDYSISSSNARNKRYIEMFLFGNGHVQQKAKKRLFPQINKKEQEKKIKELEEKLTPMTTKLKKKL